MPFTISCPFCHQPLSVSEAYAGQVVACPHCRGSLAVPANRPQPEHDLNTFRVPHAPRRRPKRGSGSSAVIVTAVVFGCAAIAGGAYLLQTGRSPSASPTEAQAKTTPPVPQSTANARPVTPTAPTRAVALKHAPASQQWKTDAKIEYRVAVRLREEEIREEYTRIGGIPIQERRASALALRTLMADPFMASDTLMDQARNIAPRYIDAIRREKVLRNPALYKQLVGDGALPRRYPIERRQQLYAEFAKALGISAEWSFVVPFEDFDAAEMDAAVAACATIKRDGFSRLNKDQRGLLLKGGAWIFFAKQVDEELPSFRTKKGKQEP